MTSTCEWIGGRRAARTYVVEDGRVFRPHLVLWLDAADGAVVGQQVVYPEDSDTVVVDCFRQCLEQPLSGPERRPTRLQVESEAVAGYLRESYPDIDVRVVSEASPELDDAAAQISEGDPEEAGVRGTAQSPGPLRATANSHDHAGLMRADRVDPRAASTFFSACAAFYRRAPWEQVGDDFLVRIDAPALGLHNACAAILGAQGESYGLALLESSDDYQRLVSAVRQDTEWPDSQVFIEGLGVPLWAVQFIPGHELPKPLRLDIARRGWPIASAQAYPVLLRIDADGVVRPLVTHDYYTAAACAAALTTLSERHQRLFTLPDAAAVSFSIQVPIGDEQAQLTASAPHHDMSLVFRAGISPLADDVLRTELEEATEHAAHRLVDEYVSVEAARGRDDGWQGVAEFVGHNLCEWHLIDSELPLDEWTADEIESYLLEYLPHAVGGDTAAFGVVPDVLDGFFTWLAEQGILTAARAAALSRRINKVRRPFLEAMRLSNPSAGAGSVAGGLIQIGPQIGPQIGTPRRPR